MNDGQPAFPVGPHSGLTKSEWLIGQCVIAAADPDWEVPPDRVAERAIQIANEIIKQGGLS